MTPEQGGGLPVIHLSQLLRAPVLARSGEAFGRVEDVIVRLRGADEYPLVTGIVAEVGGRQVFVGSHTIHDYAPGRITLTKNKIDMRGFERRDGEVLLRADILGHRLIDVAAVELVSAYDAELEDTGEGGGLHPRRYRRSARGSQQNRGRGNPRRGAQRPRAGGRCVRGTRPREGQP